MSGSSAVARHLSAAIHKSYIEKPKKWLDLCVSGVAAIFIVKKVCLSNERH